jgi:hypothetical protein
LRAACNLKIKNVKLSIKPYPLSEHIRQFLHEVELRHTKPHEKIESQVLLASYESRFKFLVHLVEQILDGAADDSDHKEHRQVAVTLGIRKEGIPNNMYLLSGLQFKKLVEIVNKNELGFEDLSALLTHEFPSGQGIVGYLVESRGFPTYVTDADADLRIHSYSPENSGVLRAEKKLYGVDEFKCVFEMPVLWEQTDRGNQFSLVLIYVDQEHIPLTEKCRLAELIPHATITAKSLIWAGEEYIKQLSRQRAEQMMNYVAGLHHEFGHIAGQIRETIRNLFPFIPSMSDDHPYWPIREGLVDKIPELVSYIDTHIRSRPERPSWSNMTTERFQKDIELILKLSDNRLRDFFGFLTRFIDFVYPTQDESAIVKKKEDVWLTIPTDKDFCRVIGEWWEEINIKRHTPPQSITFETDGRGVQVYERDGVRFMLQRLMENSDVHGRQDTIDVNCLIVSDNGNEFLEFTVSNELNVIDVKSENERQRCSSCQSISPHRFFRFEGTIACYCEACIVKRLSDDVSSNWWLPRKSGQAEAGKKYRGSGTGLGLFMVERVATDFYRGSKVYGVEWKGEHTRVYLGFRIPYGERGFLFI